MFTTPNPVNIPGNTVMMDLAFWGQPNPFVNKATARFMVDPFKDAIQDVKPPQTFYHSVVGNNYAEPFIYPIDLTPTKQQALEKRAGFKFQTEKGMASAMGFDAPMPKFSASECNTDVWC